MRRATSRPGARMPKTPHIRRSPARRRRPSRALGRGDERAVTLQLLCLRRRGSRPDQARRLASASSRPRFVTVCEREAVRVLPDERHELGALAAQQADAVAGLPAVWNARHVGDEPDAADDRGGRDRAPAGLVVERDVAGDDGDAELVGGPGDALDRLLELPRDLRLLGAAEVEAVGERERFAAGARDVQRRVENGARSRPRRDRARRGAARRARRRARAPSSRSTAASSPGRRTVREPTRWSYCS